MKNIFGETEEYIQNLLNGTPELSGCTFLAENRKDIDYEIRQAVGRQGMVGVVFTPKATFAGAFMDYGLAWECELEIDIVENPIVNRGQKDKANIATGQDIAAMVADTLCPLSGDREGQFSPINFEQGEDGGLVVNKMSFKCIVHPEDPNAFTYIYGPFDEPKKVMWRGEVTKQMVEDAGLLSTDTDFGIKFGLAAKSIGVQAFEGCQHLREIESFGSISAIDGSGFSDTGLITPVVLPQLEDIRDNTFAQCSALQGVQMQEGLDWIYAQAFYGCSSIYELVIPASVTKVGYNAFANMDNLQGIYFLGKTQAQLHDLKTWGNDNYPWGIADTSKIHAELDPPEKYTYALLDGELLSALYEGAFTNEMLTSFAPSSYTNITDLSVGTGIDSLSAFCLQYGSKLSSVVLPHTITEIGDGAFYMSGSLKDVQMKEGISSIGQDCFFKCESLRTLEIPSTVQTIGRMAFKVTNNPYGQELSSITFKGKTLAQVQSMADYPWGIRNTSVIHAELG